MIKMRWYCTFVFENIPFTYLFGRYLSLSYMKYLNHISGMQYRQCGKMKLSKRVRFDFGELDIWKLSESSFTKTDICTNQISIQ